MGVDKAELELDGRRLIDRAAQTLAVLAERVLLASGASERYTELGCECVLDEVRDAGPLAGLAAGLAAARTRWVAVLACDMPYVRPELITALVARACRDGLDGAAFRSESGAEPLCAVYSTACLEAVRGALARNERRMISFWNGRDGLRRIRVGAFSAVELEAELGLDLDRQVLNVNTPEELARERTRTQGGHNGVRSA